MDDCEDTENFTLHHFQTTISRSSLSPSTDRTVANTTLPHIQWQTLQALHPPSAFGFEYKQVCSHQIPDPLENQHLWCLNLAQHNENKGIACASYKTALFEEVDFDDALSRGTSDARTNEWQCVPPLQERDAVRCEQLGDNLDSRLSSSGTSISLAAPLIADETICDESRWTKHDDQSYNGILQRFQRDHSFQYDDFSDASSLSQDPVYTLDDSDPSSSSTSLSTLSHGTKRSRQDNLYDDSSKDSTSERGRATKRLQKVVSGRHVSTQRFACPYAKYDATRYSAANLNEQNYRRCSMCYFTDISRVKQHLYRVHERPQIYCSNCHRTFKRQYEYTKHVKAVICTPQPCPFEEKMTQEQLTIIKRKNRGNDPALSWYDIYTTLFPQESLPDSPYATFVNNSYRGLDDFIAFAEMEIPGRLGAKLRTRLPPGLSLEPTFSITDDLLRSCVGDVLSGIRADYERHQSSDISTLPTSHLDEMISMSSETSGDENSMLHAESMAASYSVLDSTRLEKSKSLSGLHFSTTAIENQFREEHLMADKDKPGDHAAQHSGLTGEAQPTRLIPNLGEHESMQDLLCEPLTAIRDHCAPDSVASGEADHYFVDRHASGPAVLHSIHFEDNGAWFPTMVSTKSLPFHTKRGKS